MDSRVDLDGRVTPGHDVGEESGSCRRRANEHRRPAPYGHAPSGLLPAGESEGANFGERGATEPRVFRVCI
jgi:hypothetical protein